MSASTASVAAPVADVIAEHSEWHEARLAALIAPQGNLALVETRWLPDGVQQSASDALVGQPATVTATVLQRRNLDTGAPEHGVRLWDSASPAIQAFDTVPVFDYDPAWLIQAEFTPVAEGRTVPFEHIRDNGGSRDLVVPGDIRFTLGDTEYTMSAFDDGGTLLLVFGDATNGQAGDTGTYGSGRFLFVQRSDGGSFGTPGPVTLDFNRAFVPPCGFSVQYNCPMPPAQNRFALPVEAGERVAQFTGGFDIYTL
ncbi:DUF1684 domain-containing protein [Microterricola viridarii]|uniref:DUF1684 domain-containing protein n=1 Tax=Microterricola viridarii TaxID=412690 RepID=A0A109QXE1_9MICO|nr:DUF1684 domain-containing protein [Microterricola viridarii]AMB58175.1 hypothetical protein AWU67_04120 [Microterricola viridarii]